MKKIIFYIILLFCLFNKIDAQNLVPNYSFEEYDTCPNNFGQIYHAIPWFQPNIIIGNTTNSSSTDYFNQCNSNNTSTNVPKNIVGFQYAKTGVGYAGFGIYYPYPNQDFGREYVETKLVETLIAGKKYCIEFYVSLADSCKYAVDAIGIYFSQDSLLNSSYSFDYLPYNPQVSNTSGNIIKDTSNWILISGEFIATGVERFITIGNYSSGTATNVDSLSGGPFIPAYYYLDDVSVYLCDTVPIDTTNDDIFIPNIFSPNDDGNNDVLYVRSHNLKDMKFCIYNRWGEMVFESKDINSGWDGRYKKGVCTGVYVYYLTGTLKDGKQVFKKGDVTLIR